MEGLVGLVGFSDSEYFQKCRYIHEVELVNMKLQMRILETHLENFLHIRYDATLRSKSDRPRFRTGFINAGVAVIWLTE
ncbi:unnamed protein product [Heligmosomoides polygyrus]|uniref:PAS domain-containing protein n=1 Tax=Heligmosomoides polygyrus TaxID=6339 RepID=A0A183F4M2_HELPZ|nr:unnamed protein product [Heligmosomoides polygyrus]